MKKFIPEEEIKREILYTNISRIRVFLRLTSHEVGIRCDVSRCISLNSAGIFSRLREIYVTRRAG